MDTGAVGGQEKGQFLDFSRAAYTATGDDVAVEDILIIMFQNRSVLGLYDFGEPAGNQIFLEVTL